MRFLIGFHFWRKSEIQFQAYKLIPKSVLNNELGKQFNEGIKEAINSIAFVVSKQGKLVKIADSLIDFTFLSENKFIGEKVIKEFIDINENEGKISSKVFIKNTGFGQALKSLGASCFEWSSLQKLLLSKCFIATHSIENNIELIRHLKYISENKSVIVITNEKLRELPFIFDHKNILNVPTRVYFPTAEDVNWNNPESELAFLHKKLQDWLSREPGMRLWIEQLGVVEKTDISFITKTIIPNAASYITKENAIQTILDFFNLYKKGELNADLLSKLSKLKLFTKNDNLLAAEDCFLSNLYSPRLEIENVLDGDQLISEKYLIEATDKDEWKRFFKLLGVKDGIVCCKYDKKSNKCDFISLGFLEKYFEEDDKKFKPFQSTFVSNYYRKLATLDHINNTKNNYHFAKIFWDDVIINISLVDITSTATAYWGHEGRPGQISGDEVQNYIPWYIKNIPCIPVLTKECQVASSVFLNTDYIKTLVGNYLPVFDGVDLSPNWKSFFSFKTNLNLSDYLTILREISFDTTEHQEVKKINTTRIQAIYKELLNQCINWNELEHEQVHSWASSGLLLNTKNKFTRCSTQKYFLDGNNSIFQDQFDFLEINSENKQHVNLKKLLEAFQITILTQNQFELMHENEEFSEGLRNRLFSIIPYLKIWIFEESKDEVTQENLSLLDSKISSLDIYEAATLQIKYGDVGFAKNVNVHFDQKKLFVTTPLGS